MGRRAHRSLGLEVVAVVVAVLAALGGAAEAARILAVIPIPAPSHHIAISAVTRALADQGHEVTYFSGLDKGNKINPTNNKVIHLGHPFEAAVKGELKNFWEQKRNSFQQMNFLFEFGVQMVNNTMNHQLFLAEVNKPGQKYDLIMVEAFFFQETLVALGHQFRAPVVAINPFGTQQYINDVMGNPVNPAWVPSPFLGYPDRMSFLERAANSLMHVVSHLTYHYYYMPMQQELLSKHWPDAAPIYDLLRSKVDLTLVNNHFTLAYPAPMSPNVVEIGGIQISEKPKPLPKDLQEFLDSAKEGVVYFSMGSNLKMEFIPEEKGRAILGAFAAVKQKVLLKWDGPAPKNVPANVRIVQWAPQGDLLAHPNIRVFVTHGGLLSTQESVYHGVPVVGMPMFGDQQFNMRIAVTKGFGVTVDFMTLTKEALVEALNEVIGDPKYKQMATRLSRLFRAKPMRPVEAAVWSIEHVLQHGGDHLRPSSVGMPMHQLLLLDVILAALAPVVAVLLCCRALCCGRKKAAGADKVGKRKKNN